MGIYGDRVQTSRSERRSGSFSHKRILSIALDTDSFVGQKRSKSALLSEFISAHKELESYKNGKAIKVDGRTLSIPAVTAAARYNASVILDNSSELHQQVDKSREVLQRKLDANKSVYGVSTGFGGSADTRTTRHFALGNALLQHQQSGVLPSSAAVLSSLPLSDPMSSTSMPESWVRGAILIRANSLVRGHSGVRWDLLEKMIALLKENITPLVPLRGSISASGDLSPLSYVAGTLMGNPSIRVFDGPRVFGARQVVSSRKSLKEHGIEPLPLLPKEHLGILNGTAFSASVAALALTEAAHLALLAQVCTAMGTEALLGTMASYVPFIHDVARPHPGQIEAARNILALLKGSKLAVPPQEEEVTIDNDTGVLRQDRYPLRTSPQFIGPQLEDILSALSSVTQELNSTTDNPLVESETGIIHNGGNFQAMAVTNAMEKTRLALHHFGKILFAQTTELINPAMNRGLPPNLAATDPSINYHTKGIDIAAAAYVSELGYLANPVSTHIQSAEMHNQAVNSLALISARHTISSLEILSMLIASYLYSLCQAFDLRAMEALQKKGMEDILREEVSARFGKELALDELDSLSTQLLSIIDRTMWNTSSMDAEERMTAVAGSTTTTIVDFFTSRTAAASPDFASVSEFRAAFASRSSVLSRNLQKEFLSGARGPTPASSYLGKTRAVYEFIRLKLNIKMHGMENLTEFEAGPGVDEVTVGQNVSLIYEAIRDGQMQNVIVNLFDDMGLHHSAPVTLASPTVRSPVKSQFSGYTASA